MGVFYQLLFCVLFKNKWDKFRLVFLIFRECKPRIVLSLSLTFCLIWGSCSYKIVLIKKKECSSQQPLWWSFSFKNIWKNFSGETRKTKQKLLKCLIRFFVFPYLFPSCFLTNETPEKLANVFGSGQKHFCWKKTKHFLFDFCFAISFSTVTRHLT